MSFQPVLDWIVNSPGLAIAATTVILLTVSLVKRYQVWRIFSLHIYVIIELYYLIIWLNFYSL